MKNTKKLKYSINSSVIIIAAVVVTVLLNSILIAFDEKISLEVDLTQEEFYKLSKETKEVVKNIDKETKIVLLIDGSQYKETAGQSATGLTTATAATMETKEDDPYLMSIVSLIEKYTEENSKISFEMVDYYTDPAPLWNEYYAPFMQIQQNEMVPYYAMMIIQGDKYEVIDYNSYHVQTYNKEKGVIENKSNIENAVTNKLAALSMDSEKFSAILFTQGHGEKINVEIDSILGKYSYTAGLINLANVDIPAEEKPLIIIDSPLTDFTADEIQKIDDFLKKGGNLHVYFNPLLSNEELPRLESYLADEWGIVRNHGVINDSKNAVNLSEDSASVYGVLAVGVNASHEIVEPISDSDLRIMYSSANPLEIKADKAGSINVEPVIKTSSDAALKTAETATEPVDAGDERGTYNVLLTSTREIYDLDNKKSTGKVLVCGSSYAMDTLPLESASANENLLINSFNWMNGGVSAINIDAKAFPEGSLVIQNSNKWMWFAGLVVIVPLVICAVGVIVFVRRRYK